MRWGQVAERTGETAPTHDSALQLFSDASLLASLESLSEWDWARFHQLVVELDAEDPKGWVVDQSWTDGDGVEHSSRYFESPEALWSVMEFLNDNDLIVNSTLGDWMLLGRCPLNDNMHAIESIRQGSSQDALRLMTALARADRLRGGLLCGALESGILMAVLEKVLSWWPTRRETRPPVKRPDEAGPMVRGCVSRSRIPGRRIHCRCMRYRSADLHTAGLVPLVGRQGPPEEPIKR